MDDKEMMVIISLLGLLGIINATFKGLPKDNRIALGIIGVCAVAVGIYGLITL